MLPPELVNLSFEKVPLIRVKHVFVKSQILVAEKSDGSKYEGK